MLISKNMVSFHALDNWQFSIYNKDLFYVCTKNSKNNFNALNEYDILLNLLTITLQQ